MASLVPQIENLTETVQVDLGIQQAQTFFAEDMIADAVARLVKRRGDVTRLKGLWQQDARASLVSGYQRAEHEAAIVELQRLLDLNLVVQRGRDGLPKTFRPLVPELVSHEKIATIFRDLGRPVVDVLWRDPATKAALHARVQSWRERHPLSIALAPLCTAIEKPDSLFSTESRLGTLLRGGGDPELNKWVDDVALPDWKAWLTATEGMGVDEQIETMVALACLHLHVAALWRLWGERCRPSVFVAVAGHDLEPACARSAYNSYLYWGERAHHALKRAARAAIAKARADTPGFTKVETTAEFSAWMAATIVRARSANARFQELVGEAAKTATDNFEQVLVDTLVEAFETPSGVAGKVKDFLRGTGAAAGLVGPDVYRARKRYQIDDRLIELLVRLHVTRGSPRSEEEEPLSVDALLDDVFHRYGLIVTRDRPPIREALAAERFRPVVRLLPGDEAMRRNRLLLEQRLDELRLVRRYSDASAVLNVD